MTDLTKWPRLLVTGQPVTPTQANNIILRTHDWPLCANDRNWERQVYDAIHTHGAGPQLEGDMWNWGRHLHDQFRHWQRRIGVLDLHYLHNNQIASSWIGGPHGWCDWNGNIGCTTWNIGKWPTVEAVTEDWQTIASAFPYLDFRAQLVPEEGEAAAPAVEWKVAGGRVQVIDGPSELIVEPGEPSYFTVLTPGGERGVDLDRLREALAEAVAR